MSIIILVISRSISFIDIHTCVEDEVYFIITIDVTSEKVVIKKPYIYLEGEDESKTVIQWGDNGDVETAATFSVFEDNFVAAHITFKVVDRHT